MNFFDAQDRARKTTRWLVVVYFIATALIVVGVTLVVGFALFSTSIDGYRYSPGEMLAANPVPLLKYGPDVYIGRVLEQLLVQRDTEIFTQAVYEGDIPEALKEMALAGHGLAFVPDRIVRDELANGKLAWADENLSIPLDIRMYGRAGFSPEVLAILDTLIDIDQLASDG